MSEKRRIEVGEEDGRWLEYDRDFRVELYHNDHQTTILRLNRGEAEDLYEKLTNELERRDNE